MKTYVFPVKLVQEADGRWSAVCPSLAVCATWGETKELALRNIQEAVELYVADLRDAGTPLPESLIVVNEVAVSVTV